MTQFPPRELSAVPRPGLIPLGMQDTHFQRARDSLRQAIGRYTQKARSPRRGAGNVELQASLKTDLNQLSGVLDKLNCSLLRIAVFGLVSRGKSAVINALIGQKLLPTGPINGVTQYPRSVYWALPESDLRVELIDTPGLDEVGGQTRAEMARDVAHQADLILFVIAGDITRNEYQALAELQAAHKPMLLVFNKADLYPDQDRDAIYQKLRVLFAEGGDRGRPFLMPEDVVRVSAEPASVQVRVEWPDGRVTYEEESPPPQIEELRTRLVNIIQKEGKSLLALNALRQARETEQGIARKALKLNQEQAEEMIWQFAKWKAIAVGVNPIAVLDLLGGAVTDLVMIRNLAKLYGLPMTSFEAGKLLRAILWSSGSLLLGEVGSGLLLGAGKSASAVGAMFDSVGGLVAFGSAAVAQGAIAGYGSYRVGKAAQAYLERGCTWGPDGPNTVIQDILSQVDEDTVMYRLQRELGG